MARAGANSFLRRLTRGMAAESLADLSDRELVGRLLAGPDEPAFEALVRRHGPMVYRVCWRVLQHEQEAEDAFQAAFLLLARKLPTVRRRDSLASWLHGVARRVALDAKKRLYRRHRHEAAAPPARPVPPDDLPWRELRGVLDEELATLPERHREPLVLCYLEGLSQEEAAGRLGWSKSTLLRRLQEARAALGRRLARRGLAAPAALAGVLVADCATPAAPAPQLVGPTVEAAVAALAGRALTGAVPVRVLSLTEGVTRTMFASKLNPAVPALVLAAALAAGTLELLAGGPGAAAPRPPQGYPPPDPAKAPPGVRLDTRKPVVVREDAQVAQVAWAAGGKVVGVTQTLEPVGFTDEDGKNPSTVLVSRSALKLWDAATGKVLKSQPADKETVYFAAAASPDGKLLAVVGVNGVTALRKPAGPDEKRKEPQAFLRVLDADTWAVRQELGADELRGVGQALAFSPDGRTLALGGGSPQADQGAVVRLWDLETRKVKTEARFAEAAKDPMRSPDIKNRPPEFWTVRSLAFSPDGKLLASGEFGMAFGEGGRPQPKSRARVRLYDVKTGRPLRGWEVGESRGMVPVAFAADGRTVASAAGEVKFWDAETGKELRTLDTGGTETFQLALSPDGRLVAACGLRTEKGKPVAEVRVWSARSGGLTRVVSWQDPGMVGVSLAFSRDGTTLAVGAQTTADAKVKGSEKVRGELQLIPLR